MPNLYIIVYLFFLHYFSISHLYSRTHGKIDREFTVLKRSDRDPIDSRRLELKILVSEYPKIGITNSKQTEKVVILEFLEKN